MLGGTQGPQEHSSPGGGGDKNRNCAPTAAEEDLCGRPVWAKAEAAMQITAVQRNSGRAAGLLVKSSAPGLVCLGSCSSSAPSSRFLLMWTLGRQPGTSQGLDPHTLGADLDSIPSSRLWPWLSPSRDVFNLSTSTIKDAESGRAGLSRGRSRRAQRGGRSCFLCAPPT